MSAKSVQTVSTSQVMAEVAQKFDDLPKKVTREVIADFLNLIESSVIDGHKVRLDKLGILTTKLSAERKGRNPQTGVEMMIPASKKISFRASKTLKDQVVSSKKK
jgi:DNA-binding protein HU-beta